MKGTLCACGCLIISGRRISVKPGKLEGGEEGRGRGEVGHLRSENPKSGIK